ncbi:MAG: hypothetical protein MUE97_01915 [Phycisphaerales bacterium]|jgi:hypothetical protein|nr:hypothetical protein [Phycisphaerales bacterium]
MQRTMAPRSINPASVEVVDDRIAAILRSKTPTQRLAMIFEAFAFARRLAETGARHAHPEWTEQQLREETNRRMSRASS